MNRFNAISAAAVFALLAGWSVVFGEAADPVGKLIEKELEEKSAWTEELEDLPLAYLWGNDKSAEIYSASSYAGKGNILCEPLAYDELIELSLGNAADIETILNTDIPRVREMLENACLVRPSDMLTAIGPGWRKQVSVKNFFVKKDRPVCAQDSPYSLWVSVEPVLPDVPLFFSTDRQLLDSEIPAFQFSADTQLLDDKSRAAIKGLVEAVEDYQVTSFTAPYNKEERFYHLARKVISPEDNDLPNEILLWQSSGNVGQLWLERVDLRKGSGHLRLRNALDFNLDGKMDVVVEGDHQTCPYRLVFESTADGYVKLDLPIAPCRCP